MKAILYDLDGVLVDACEWHYEAFNRALLEVCGFKIARQEHLRVFNGLPTKTKLQLLLEQGRVSETVCPVVSALKQRYTMDILESLSEDQEKRQMHAKARELGLKLACVTNSVRQSAETMLGKTGQLEYMDLVVSNQDVVHPKPCGEGYVVDMVQLGSLPRETLVVEDSPTGIQAAESVGAAVWKVTSAAEVTWSNIRRFLE